MIMVGSFVRFTPPHSEYSEAREYVGQVTRYPLTGDYLSVVVKDYNGTWNISVRREIAIEVSESEAMIWMLENL